MEEEDIKKPIKPRKEKINKKQIIENITKAKELIKKALSTVNYESSDDNSSDNEDIQEEKKIVKMNWKKLNSANLKHNYYYNEDTQDFSWVAKENYYTIAQYDENDKLIAQYKSISEASNITGEGTSYIYSYLKGKCDGSRDWYFNSSKKSRWKNIKTLRSLSDEEILEILENNKLQGTKGKDIIIKIITIDEQVKNVKKHRLIFYATNSEIETNICAICTKEKNIFDILTSMEDIDHIDGNHSNNNSENLQRICRSCHSKKTREQTKSNGKSAETRHKKIIAYKEDEPSFNKLFNSSKEAAKELFLDYTNLCEHIRNYEKTKKIVWMGSYKHNNKYRFEKYIEPLIDGEAWKYSEKYEVEVSNKGRIKHDGRITYGNKLDDGYMTIKIKGKTYKVHRIIADSFKEEEKIMKAEEIIKDKNYPECLEMKVSDVLTASNNMRYCLHVDHIDHKRDNNNIENLRWVSRIENNANLSYVRKVAQYSIENKLINIFDSIADANRFISKQSGGGISNVCSGKQLTAYGFIWQFIEDK